MAVDVLLGLQWGDEGKGKIVDYLAGNYDMVARFQGGPNAGHTLYVNGKKIVLHHIPSGIFHQKPINLIGNGVVIDAATLKAEIAKIDAIGAGVNIQQQLCIARKAHLILPTHRLLDAASEAAKGKSKIGSTLRGIGPTYTDKIARRGLRIGDIEMDDFDQRYEAIKAQHESLLQHYGYNYQSQLTEMEAAFKDGLATLRTLKLVDALYLVNDYLQAGKNILAEGAQGTMLDIDFGTYPFVTSSNTITAGVCNGLGIAPQQIGEVIGITKAYCTRVGGGPFPSELLGDKGEEIRQAGGEFGATTGRPRRCGWIDLPALKYAVLLNGVTQVVMTKVDILSLFTEIEACTAYEVNGAKTQQVPFDVARQNPQPIYEAFKGWHCDLSDFNHFKQLPETLQQYMAYVENYLGANISILSTGPERNQLVFKEAKVDAELV